MDIHIGYTRGKPFKLTFFQFLESSFQYGNLQFSWFFSIPFQFIFNLNWKIIDFWNPFFKRGIWNLDNFFQFFVSFKKIETKLNPIWKTLVQLSILMAKPIEKNWKNKNPLMKTGFEFSIFQFFKIFGTPGPEKKNWPFKEKTVCPL